MTTRVYRLKAINTATASSNKMHDDSVARTYGFVGGLVPGVDVWTYLCHLPIELWGREWLAEGGLEARFVAPIYSGDEVAVEATDPAGDAASGPLDLTARNQSGEVCATGRADRRITGPLPDIAAYPPAPLPEPPLPAATPDYFTQHPVLGTCHTVWQAKSAAVGALAGLAPPGWLLRRANDALVHNVTLGPWIHVESRARHLGVLADGEVVATRARTADVYERKGHRFVELDVLLLANDERPVMAARHVAIYRPRPPGGAVDA